MRVAGGNRSVRAAANAKFQQQAGSRFLNGSLTQFAAGKAERRVKVAVAVRFLGKRVNLVADGERDAAAGTINCQKSLHAMQKELAGKILVAGAHGTLQQSQ